MVSMEGHQSTERRVAPTTARLGSDVIDCTFRAFPVGPHYITTLPGKKKHLMSQAGPKKVDWVTLLR